MIEFTIYPEDNYALIAVAGTNSLDDFKQATQRFNQHPDFTRELHRVCNFSDSNLTGLNTLDFLRYMSFLRNLPISRKAKVALVSDGSRSLLLMFINKMTAIDIKLFGQLDDALKWIAVSQPSGFGSQVDGQDIKYHRMSGVVSIESAIEVHAQWLQDKTFSNSIPVVWDVRDAEFAVSMPQLREVADSMYHARTRRNDDGRVAILAGSKQQEIILKNAFSKGFDSGRAGLFFNESEALSWVKTTASSNTPRS